MSRRLWEYLRFGAGRPPGTMWAIEKAYFEQKFRYPGRMEMAYLFLALRARYLEKPEKQIWEIARRCSHLDDAMVEAVRIDFGAEVAERFREALPAFPMCSKCGKYRALSTKDSLCYGCREYGDATVCHHCRLYWKKDDKHCPRCGRELTEVLSCLHEKTHSEKGGISWETRLSESIPTSGEDIPGSAEPPETTEWTAERWNDEGVKLERLGFLGDALDCYTKAVGVEPEAEVAWYNKGCLHQRLGENEQALPSFHRVLELNPANAAAWNNLGNSLEAVGRLSEALECIEKALQLNPLSAEAWINQGSINLRRYRLNTALACFCRGAEVEPSNAGAWFCKGFVEKTMQSVEDAICSFERFLELAKPEDAEQIASAKRHLEELRGAKRIDQHA
jgi:tetratricopeptide (TPR) repeat protein